MKKAFIVDIISCLYVLLFLYTGINKLMEPDLFLNTLNKSALLRPYSSILATGVPVLELVIALALFLPFFMQAPRFRTWGLYSGTALMAVFTVYVWYMLRSPHDLPCSCGGIIQKMNWHQHLYFNTAFTFLGAFAIWLNQQNSKERSSNLALS